MPGCCRLHSHSCGEGPLFPGAQAPAKPSVSAPPPHATGSRSISAHPGSRSAVLPRARQKLKQAGSLLVLPVTRSRLRLHTHTHPRLVQRRSIPSTPAGRAALSSCEAWARGRPFPAAGALPPAQPRRPIKVRDLPSRPPRGMVNLRPRARSQSAAAARRSAQSLERGACGAPVRRQQRRPAKDDSCPPRRPPVGPPRHAASPRPPPAPRPPPPPGRPGAARDARRGAVGAGAAEPAGVGRGLSAARRPGVLVKYRGGPCAVRGGAVWKGNGARVKLQRGAKAASAAQPSASRRASARGEAPLGGRPAEEGGRVAAPVSGLSPDLELAEGLVGGGLRQVPGSQDSPPPAGPMSSETPSPLWRCPRKTLSAASLAQSGPFSRLSPHRAFLRLLA